MSPGKGLEALIGRKAEKPKRGSARTSASVQERQGVFFVEIAKIASNRHQPRKDFSRSGLLELAASIRTHGILQPLVVEKQEAETKKGVAVQYHLLAGERRLRAAKLVGLKSVPVVIRQAHDDRTRLLVALIENVQREDLNAMERAEAYARLRDDFGLAQDEVAKRVGKSRESVANTLRLLQLPQTMRQAIRNEAISEGHARALLAVEGRKREKLFSMLKIRPMSVREAEALARTLQGSRAPVRAADPRRAAEEEKLYQAYGVPVRITARGERGSIAFIFQSKEDLKALLRRFLRK